MLSDKDIKEYDQHQSLQQSYQPIIPSFVSIDTQSRPSSGKPKSSLTERLDLDNRDLHQVPNLASEEMLKLLNLQHNHISCIDAGLGDMENLTELNLRRNEITSVTSLEQLHFLQRVYLSFNKIHRWEDVWCLGECPSLVELTLDGNPLTDEPSYRHTVLASSSKIKMLDGKRTTEEERRTAASLLKKEIEKKKAEERAHIRAERRKLAISNAARLWRSEYRSKDADGATSVSPDFGIYTGPVNVLDIGDSHLIEFWPENNSIRLFGSESIQYIEKAIDSGVKL